MISWRSKTVNEQITRLRAVLHQSQRDLAQTEAELSERQAEVNAFEFEFEARVGYLMDKLQVLETEIEQYANRIDIIRNERIFGYAHASVDRQYRRVWQTRPVNSPPPAALPLTSEQEAEIKRLYHQLARRFHPDLARHKKGDVAYYTEKMAAINAAYAARNLTELLALVQEVELIPGEQFHPGLTQAQLVQALQAELARCQQRLHAVEQELQALAQRSSVQLSLEVEIARRHGRDLLAELAADIERKIARRLVERDLLQAQFEQLGPEHGFIPL